MNVTYQIMDQMFSAVQTAPEQPAGSSGERSQFERMIQEKYQAAKGEAMPKEDAPAQKEPENAGEAEVPGEQPASEQYALAAALMAAYHPIQMAEAPQQTPQTEALQGETAPQAAEGPLPVLDGRQQTVPTAEGEPQPAETQPIQSPVAAPETQEAMQPQGEGSQQTADGRLDQTPAAEGEPKLETADAAPEPLFADVKATPVKVAPAPEQPLEAQEADLPEKLADRVKQAMDQGSSKVEISLSPRNLGNLTVEMTRAGDGTLSVVLSASTPKAAAVLEQHSSNLQNLLMANTQSQVKVEIHGGQESAAQQFLNPDDGRNGQSRQQEQRQAPDRQKQSQDFLQRLRLGLVELDQAVS